MTIQKFTFILAICFFSIFQLQGQVNGTIRGTIVDQESKYPLIGVNVQVQIKDGELLGASTDLDGTYRIDNIPVGRQTVLFTYLGYKEIKLSDIIVGSGKEVILNIDMEESTLELDEIIITAKRGGEVLNEMATVSAREFSVQETNRYAGSRGEPARMASNFAGVQGADDSRNDVIIRGNSPSGVLWRFEGVNIPNPNHFSIPGTGGGSVTILNNKYLSNSDFFTGAFPAEYGNGVAGVFDLKMRNGNNEKHEFSGQLGFLGTELMAEGPIPGTKKASYLVSYRYSTLALFKTLSIDVGTDAIPRYQDAAFRLNFPRKNGGNIAFFGIGGNSNIDILISDEEAPSTETLIYGSNDRDQYFGSRMATTGISYTQPLNENTFIKAVVSASTNQINADHRYIYRQVTAEGNYQVDSLPQILDYTFNENKYGAYFAYNRKLSKKGSIKAGINIDVWDVSYFDKGKTIIPADSTGGNASLGNWRVRWDATDIIPQVQPFIQYKYKFNDKLKMVAGLTSLYFGINDKSLSPIEPRFGLSYDIDEKSKIGFGAGLHSQIQSPYIYYYGAETIDGDPQEHNLDRIGLLKSGHLVLSYDRFLGKNMRMKSEVYYQRLYDLPIGEDVNSFSLINAGSGFSRFFPDTLATGGAGQNMGIELTIEKFFSNGYFYMLTGSIYDSKYKGSDDVWRNASFNGQFAFNALATKEWNIRKNQTISLGGKLTYSGGRWYGPVDLDASVLESDVIYVSESLNTLKFAPYFRADANVKYRLNTKKLTHEIGIDLVNVFDIQNILTLTFAPDHPDGPIVEEYQLGFLPLFYYRIDF